MGGVIKTLPEMASEFLSLTAHSHYIANVHKKVKSEVETSSLTFLWRKYGN